MPIKTEPVHAGEFIISEAPGTLSRENIVIKSGENLPAGQVLKFDATETTKGVARSGSGTSIGVLYAAVDATDGDVEGVMVSRLAEYDSSLLTDYVAAVGTTLAGNFMIDRS